MTKKHLLWSTIWHDCQVNSVMYRNICLLLLGIFAAQHELLNPKPLVQFNWGQLIFIRYLYLSFQEYVSDDKAFIWFKSYSLTRQNGTTTKEWDTWVEMGHLWHPLMRESRTLLILYEITSFMMKLSPPSQWKMLIFRICIIWFYQHS